LANIITHSHKYIT